MLRFPGSFLYMQMKLASFTPEIVPPLKNTELRSHFTVYRKIAASAQTEGWLTKDGPLYTGH